MTFPRQLEPTVGLVHGGFEFLKGSFEGLKGYDVGRMTKSRPGKLYIDNANWGPDASSIEYGYRVPSAEFMSLLARLVSRALSRTSAPISSRRLSDMTRPDFACLEACFRGMHPWRAL